jgi:two-component system, chemotaxis family, response regulator Rcp1
MQDPALGHFILVIDGKSHHRQAIQQALTQRQRGYQIETLADGVSALDFLYQREAYTQASRPDLILLDLDLPGRDGHEVLAAIKLDPRLKRIPVIVFTESTQSDQVFQSYFSQGNCYVVKAADIEELAEAVKRIEDFWLEIVTLPLK